MSADVATPNSPIPAARASAVIIRKGTPVVTTRLEFCEKFFCNPMCITKTKNKSNLIY